MQDGSGSFSLLALFQMGGAFMWPLLVFSVATIALAVERTVYLLYHNLRLDDIRDVVEGYIREKNIPAAKEYLESIMRRRIGARTLLALVSRAGLSEHRIEKAVEAQAQSTLTALENGFNFLTTLGSIAPLTGFLGTVSGMIGAFKSIAEATEVNAQIVANGIYEALITTVFGLIIAIIAVAAHSILSHVVDKFAAEIEKICADFIAELALENSVEERNSSV
ncbi:MAG: MotA/TolQ/ExbB proton channel family protein [Spirochaetales bacterium]|jgi:biopolymer transport protein ExbB|nr:MotA/TolQ/ExbB proton channel family protein [Spirochaetales bacterium]